MDIISWTFLDRLELLEKLTRYLRENVSVTAWFISIRTPSKSSSSSSSASSFFAFFAGLLCQTHLLRQNRVWAGDYNE